MPHLPDSAGRRRQGVAEGLYNWLVLPDLEDLWTLVHSDLYTSRYSHIASELSKLWLLLLIFEPRQNLMLCCDSGIPAYWGFQVL
jgi:hypothetical protein